MSSKRKITKRVGPVTLAETIESEESLSLESVIPGRLKQCSFCKSVLNTPCRVRLTDRRYNLISQRSYQTQYVDSKQGTISFSILHSILAQMIKKSKGGKACFGGEAMIRILGHPEQTEHRGRRFSQSSQQIDGNRVITELSFIRLISRKKGACWLSSLVYIPVHIDWVNSATAEKLIRAKRQKKPKTEQICSGCEAHASAILIDTVHKTLQVYDSNGTGASWYATISDWVNTQFDSDPTLRKYQMLPEAALPQMGPQSETNLSLCAYFSALYVCLRIHCTQFSAQEANNLLLEIGRRNMYDLLSRFHCFLIDYAYTNGILQAANELPQLYGKAFFIVANADYFDIPSEQADVYWQQLGRIERIAYFDILTAYNLIQNLMDKLPTTD